jgi:hypothetical protein
MYLRNYIRITAIPLKWFLSDGRFPELLFGLSTVSWSLLGLSISARSKALGDG